MSTPPSEWFARFGPRPRDDGGGRHLEGKLLPFVELASTSADPVDLQGAARSGLVLYVYPRTAVPGQPLPANWHEIPGASGCTTESCAFRDHASELRSLGAQVIGLSSQSLEEQREFAERQHIGYPLLSDPTLVLHRLLGLPVFEADGQQLYKRITLIFERQRIVKVFYPIYPPDSHPAEVAAWLRARKAPGGSSLPAFD
jgi:peroxiredoxin